MKQFFCLLFGALLAAAAKHPLADQPVPTRNGLITGVATSDGAVASFKGIPFAAPPVGELRWRAPKPAAQWEGVRKAEDFSASCVQRIVQERKPWTYEFMAHNSVSEDCLYLNVWTGAKASTERRPVFVWIYGGGYNEGSAAVPAYDGENLARRGIVVVTINYRVGLLGFLAHPDLTKESGTNQSSGNYGTLDQIAALQWVQQNIAGFGGDPNRVTVGGQSAGASSVHNLVASPLAKGLFQRAIAQSGSSVAAIARGGKLADAEAAGLKFTESKGFREVQPLRAMPWDILITPPVGGFRPVVDGWVLPASPLDVLAAGKQNDVPTLTGLTADEGSSSPEYGKVPGEKWREQMQQRFGAMADGFFKLYPVDGGAEAQKAGARDMGLVSMHLWAAHRAKTAKTKAFTYYWTHTMPGPDAERFGAFHTSEVPYVFQTLDKAPAGSRVWSDRDRKIAETMGSYWINFITTGDPNGKGLEPWPAFDAKAAKTMELGGRFGVRPVADPAKADFFSKFLLQSAKP
jgi:para-nitrobenzyl esterase